MIQILNASEKDILLIQKLSYKIWPNVYKNIISIQQIDFMLDLMYSTNALKSQITLLGIRFKLVKSHDFIGYFSYEINALQEGKTKIHKIYLDETYRMGGYGRSIIEYIEKDAIASKDKTLILRVNRNNPAINFYKKLGFLKVKEDILDLGLGYIMDDWIMEKSI